MNVEVAASWRWTPVSYIENQYEKNLEKEYPCIIVQSFGQITQETTLDESLQTSTVFTEDLTPIGNAEQLSPEAMNLILQGIEEVENGHVIGPFSASELINYFEQFTEE